MYLICYLLFWFVSVFTPYYSETVLYSTSELQKENEDGISILFYLQKIFPGIVLISLPFSVRFHFTNNGLCHSVMNAYQIYLYNDLICLHLNTKILFLVMILLLLLSLFCCIALWHISLFKNVPAFNPYLEFVLICASRIMHSILYFGATVVLVKVFE